MPKKGQKGTNSDIKELGNKLANLFDDVQDEFEDDDEIFFKKKSNKNPVTIEKEKVQEEKVVEEEKVQEKKDVQEEKVVEEKKANKELKDVDNKNDDSSSDNNDTKNKEDVQKDVPVEESKQDAEIKVNNEPDKEKSDIEESVEEKKEKKTQKEKVVKEKKSKKDKEDINKKADTSEYVELQDLSEKKEEPEVKEEPKKTLEDYSKMSVDQILGVEGEEELEPKVRSSEEIQREINEKMDDYKKVTEVHLLDSEDVSINSVEPLEAEATNISPNAIDKIQADIEKYNEKVNQKASIEKINETIENLRKITTLPAELQSEEFDRQFALLYKQELGAALRANDRLREEGKISSPTHETLNGVDAYMRGVFDYYKATGLIDPNRVFLENGGVDAKEIRDMQMGSILGDPHGNERAEEKKYVEEQFATNQSKQAAQKSDNFADFIKGLNAAEGVNFSSKFIKQYLQSQWNASKDKDPAKQRENFDKAFRNFATLAYQKMLGNTNVHTDINVRTQNFDRLCTQLENVCKENGWMDKNAPHKLYGGISGKDLSLMTKEVTTKLPKTVVDSGENFVNKMEKRESTAKIAQMALKGVPDAKDKDVKLDNTPTRRAVAIMQALDRVHSSRSRIWKMTHPILNSQEKQAIEDIQKGLKEKGYDDIVNYYKTNPIKAEDDPVTKKYNEQLKDVNNISKHADEVEKAKGELDKGILNKREGVRISVPEADTVKEITQPEIKSPACQPPNRQKVAEKSAPQNSGK